LPAAHEAVAFCGGTHDFAQPPQFKTSASVEMHDEPHFM
jgi:hypothetical protein